MGRSLTVVVSGTTTYSGSIAGDSTFNKNGVWTLYFDGNSELNLWNISSSGSAGSSSQYRNSSKFREEWRIFLDSI
jgi:hypothetical protein